MKINTNKIEKIQVEADIKEKRAQVRILDVDKISYDIKRIEKKLSTLLPKKSWKGLRFSIDQNAQHFPSSYNGAPESTQYTLERGSNDWFITSIVRTYCKGETQYIIPLNLHERAEEIAAYVSKSSNW